MLGKLTQVLVPIFSLLNPLDIFNTFPVLIFFDINVWNILISDNVIEVNLVFRQVSRNICNRHYRK